MHPLLKHPSALAFEDMSPSDLTAMLTSARALQLADEAGKIQPMLRGRKLGLLCEVDGGDAAVLFRGAALELGAHVAHVRPSLSGLSTPEDVQHTARVLGRLYDAVECQGMAPALVQQMGVDAGVPVYDGVASQGHPTAKLAEQLGGETSALSKRRFVLQAVLLSTIV